MEVPENLKNPQNARREGSNMKCLADYSVSVFFNRFSQILNFIFQFSGRKRSRRGLIQHGLPGTSKRTQKWRKSGSCAENLPEKADFEE